MSIRAVQATIENPAQEYVTPADDEPGSLNGDEPPSIEEEPPHATPLAKAAAPTRTPRPAIWSHIPDSQWDDWRWQREEWDVSLSNGGTYLIFRCAQGWFIEAEYD